MIEEFIPEGYENRVSRDYLKTILHIPDREIRGQIEQAVNRGILIVSCGGGYFQVGKKDQEYVADYFRREEHRNRTQGSNVRKKKKLWQKMTGIDPKQIPGQISLFKE